MQAKALLLATLAAAATAQQANVLPEAQVAKRTIEAIVARETDAMACATAAASIYVTLPTPPPEVLSYEMSNPQTDPCSYSVPATLSAPFSSYTEAVKSWYSGHSAEVNSVLKACSITNVAGQVPVCTNSAAGKPTVAGGAGGSSTKNAGAKETGMVAAAVAAVGFIGAIAAM